MAQVCTSHFALVMFGVGFRQLRIPNTSSSLMCHPNLLGLHPESFTSFFSTPSQPLQITCSTKPDRASLTEIRWHSSATSPEGQSGYLADSVSLTEYEPETCIDVGSEHTPINYPYGKNSFNIEDNVTTTVAASETTDGFQKQAAASGSSQFVPTSELNAWLHAEPCSACSRQLLRSDVSNITHVEETYSKGKRDRDLESVRTLSERRDSLSTSGRKLTWLFDKNAQLRDDYLKLKRTWKQESGKREGLMWVFMKPIENLSLNDWSCFKLIDGLADQAQREDYFFPRIGNETPTISSKSCKRLPRN